MRWIDAWHGMAWHEWIGGWESGIIRLSLPIPHPTPAQNATLNKHLLFAIDGLCTIFE